MPVPSQPVAPASAAKVEKAPGIVSETARRFSGNRLSMLGLLVVVLILAAAILADFLAPYPRDHVFFADMLKDPEPGAPPGHGRVGARLPHAGAARRPDIDARRTAGAHPGGALGIPVGAIAGWRGGRFDTLFMRVVEIWTAIPTYMLAILFVAVWGGGLDKLILYL